MHELLERHGDNAVCAACECGIADGIFGAEYVAFYLTTIVDAPRAVRQQETLS